MSACEIAWPDGVIVVNIGNKSRGSLRNSAGCRYTADIVCWRLFKHFKRGPLLCNCIQGTLYSVLSSDLTPKRGYWIDAWTHAAVSFAFASTTADVGLDQADGRKCRKQRTIFYSQMAEPHTHEAELACSHSHFVDLLYY